MLGGIGGRRRRGQQRMRWLDGTTEIYTTHNTLSLHDALPISDAGRDWGQEEKGTTEDEMAGWHH